MTDYVREALAARLAASAGRDLASMAEHVRYLNPLTFCDEEGDIDQAKVDAYASTIGGPRPAPRNVIREAMTGQQRAGGRGRVAGGSIEELQREWLDRKGQPTNVDVAQAEAAARIAERSKQ